MLRNAMIEGKWRRETLSRKPFTSAEYCIVWPQLQIIYKSILIHMVLLLSQKQCQIDRSWNNMKQSMSLEIFMDSSLIKRQTLLGICTEISQTFLCSSGYSWINPHHLIPSPSSFASPSASTPKWWVIFTTGGWPWTTHHNYILYLS